MLMRFDPFRELDRLTNGPWPATNARPGPMAMDAYRRGDELLVHFDLPGIDPGSVEVTAEKNVLTVQAERSWERDEGDEVIVAERPQGRFTRQVFLGESLDSDRVGASYEQGVLTLRIPVAEAARPRRIEVSHQAKPAAIDTSATEHAVA